MTAELAQKRADVPAIRSMDDLDRMASLFAQSGFFKDSKDAAQCGIRILAGIESGFGAFASMTGVHIIEGKPTFSANLMAQAVKRSGRYNFRVVEHTDEACTIKFFERWGSEWQEVGESRFTLEDARRANLAGRGVWKSYPRNMCYARAMSNGVRWYAPDAVGVNAYTPEELGASVDGEGNILALPETPSASSPKAIAQENGITASQVQALSIALKEGKFGTDEAGKVQGRAFIAWLVGVDQLHSVKSLTKEQAQVALDRLGSGENGSYRTDKKKLETEFQEYTEWRAGLEYDLQNPLGTEQEQLAPAEHA